MEQLSIKLPNQHLIDTVAHQAANSERLRRNYNFHQLSETVQRLINMMQPGSYIRPHCHNGFEFFLVLQGKMESLGNRFAEPSSLSGVTHSSND